MNFLLNICINKIKIFVIILSVSITIMSASCNKESSKPCRNAVYSFNVTSTFTPEKEIYNIGDTILFFSEFPKNLTNNSYPNASIDYSNAVNIAGDITFSIFDSLAQHLYPAKDSFSFISTEGSFKERTSLMNQGINFLYFEKPTSYVFSGKFVCRRKGNYALGVFDFSVQGIKGKDCTNASFVMTVTNVNKHFYIYQNIFGVPPEQYTLQRGYVFRVQ